jgi:hypothetical protein
MGSGVGEENKIKRFQDSDRAYHYQVHWPLDKSQGSALRSSEKPCLWPEVIFG